MKEKENNGGSLALANTTQVTTDLFGESKAKRLTSLDLNDEAQADMFLNAQSEADYKLNDEVGKVLEVIGAIIGEYPTETVNDETGEMIIRKKHSLCLFTKDGKSHVTGSGTCYYSFAQIVTLKGMPTKDNPLLLEVIKTPAETKGHEYLKVKIAKKNN